MGTMKTIALILVSMLLAGEAMAWPGFRYRAEWIRPVTPVRTIRPVETFGWKQRMWETKRIRFDTTPPKLYLQTCWDGTRRSSCPPRPWPRIR